nr:alanine dehydrogenase [uncultured bacterium]
MQFDGTLLLRRTDVRSLLSLPDCIDAVEKAFRSQGEGKISAPKILSVSANDGGLHVKAARLSNEKSYIVAKLNTNFTRNSARFGLPTIQGLIVICDAENGAPLAVLDSIDVTIKRTAAASAIAVKYLARKDSHTALLCGCGEQGRTQLQALLLVRDLKKIYVFDVNERAMMNLISEIGVDLEIEPVRDLASALCKSDICVTCTTSEQAFVRKSEVSLGTFIAAVGADNEHKQEIEAELMASAKVVADSVEQCCAIGDTHHAIAEGLMRKENVYAELCEIVAGLKPGRSSDDEIIVFDSTGTAIEDAVASVALYEKACAMNIGVRFDFPA